MPKAGRNHLCFLFFLWEEECDENKSDLEKYDSDPWFIDFSDDDGDDIYHPLSIAIYTTSATNVDIESTFTSGANI